jgi:hypothetical protein
MTKNIFVTAQYDVGKRYSHNAETTKEDYRRLTDICVESFRKNLFGLDEVVILSGEVENYHQLFKDIYWKIREIYHSQECNILWSDSDNLCLKPWFVFAGKWTKFSMFYWDNQHQFSFLNQACLDLVKNLNPWMMANLRYYPSTMDRKLWDIGDDLAFCWIDEWAYETIIYNKMFHSQDITNWNEYYIPALNKQVDGPVGMINPEMVRDNVVLHCQSTRGSKQAIEKMERALNFLNTI